jgi:hypothetical protein
MTDIVLSLAGATKLYAGVPAKPIAPLDAQMAYFSRTRGFIE